jgi:hypothetical protein
MVSHYPLRIFNPIAMPKRFTNRGVPARKSRIGADVLQAYRATSYGVDAVTPFAVCVGQASTPLHNLMVLHQCHSAAYITACNPLGRCLGDADNARRQAALAQHLWQKGYVFFTGEGIGVDDRWAAEPSFLVLGIPLLAAKAVGHRWRQNAILWCGADAVPQLVLLR